MMYFYYERNEKSTDIRIFAYEIFPKGLGYGREGFIKMKYDLTKAGFKGKIIIDEITTYATGFFQKMKNEGLVDDIVGGSKYERPATEEESNSFEYSEDDVEYIKTNYDLEKKILRRWMHDVLKKENETIDIIDDVYDQLELLNKN
jgi:hypothetical protein